MNFAGDDRKNKVEGRGSPLNGNKRLQTNEKKTNATSLLCPGPTRIPLAEGKKKGEGLGILLIDGSRQGHDSRDASRLT